MKKTLALLVLTFTLVGAARADLSKIQILNAAGQVIATGARSGHLTFTGDLASARTLRVSTTVGGTVIIRTFTLVGSIGVTEAEALRVQVGQNVLTLDSALEKEHAAPVVSSSANHSDPITHDTTDDRGAHSPPQTGEDHPATGDDHTHSTPAPAGSGTATTPDDHGGSHSDSGHSEDHGGKHGGGHH